MDGLSVIVTRVFLLLTAWCGTGLAKGDDYGHWAEWSKWSKCNAKCGNGVVERFREWVPGTSFVPSEDGTPYTSSQMYSCTSEEAPNCPVHGRWSEWTSWSRCTKPCGQGVKTSTRKCYGQKYNGKVCEGDDKKEAPCNRDPCPASRVVKGSRPAPGNAMDRSTTRPACEGDDKKEAPCNRDPCPVLPRGFQMSQCTETFFNCTSKKMCIPGGQRCDEAVQCHDGSDEIDCPRMSSQRGRIKYDLSQGGGASTVSLTRVLMAMTVYCVITSLATLLPIRVV